MNRREFTALVAAGALLPVDFVKGLATYQSNPHLGSSITDVPRSPGVRIFCCGSDYNPATWKQIAQLMDFVEIEKRWSYIIEYGRAIGAPLSAIYQLDFPFNRLVVGLGSDDRPAQQEDLIEVRHQLLGLAEEWEESTVVTHYNFCPYEFQKGILHDPPLVISHQWAEWALRFGMIRLLPLRFDSARRILCGGLRL